MQPLKTYGIGLLGCGFIGRVHAFSHQVMHYYYPGLPWRARLAAVCTSRPQTAQQVAQELGFESWTTDPAEVIERPGVDVVHVCTPNACHKDELLAVLAAGKHVYCDKPLTADWAEAKQVLAALEGYRGVHQMTLQNRFYPATMCARQLMAEGALGELTCFRAVFLHAGNVDRSKAHGWKFEPAGGVLNDLATHVVDLMQHLIGRFDEVFCADRIWARERPVRGNARRPAPVEAEDHACMTCRRDDGLVGAIEATKLATGMQDELRFEIHGERGALAFNLMEPNWLEFYDAGAAGEPMGGRAGFTRIPCVRNYPELGASWPYAKSSIGWTRSHVACLHNFMAAVHDGRRAEPGLEVGAQLQQFVDAAKLSAREGRFVRVETV